MPSQDDIPGSDQARQSYNFAPGYYGLVYRADVPDYGAGTVHADDSAKHGPEESPSGTQECSEQQREEDSDPRYKLQAMKWGLIPFWTKRNPDYGSMMRAINCRDDSLASSGGMWNTMKQKKRCIVVVQGFYEWLKKNGGKEKLPHYVKRKDGRLMCFAGLWDCTKFEDAENKLYSYTIITTSSNKQLGFLHDRMPVILDNGSDDMFKWLDSGRSEWSKELQSLLQPFPGELECYPVSREVGKVGNDSPNFVVPLDSTANKQNIANFFGNQKSPAKKPPSSVKAEGDDELLAPKPLAGTKREQSEEGAEPYRDAQSATPAKAARKLETSPSKPGTTPGKKVKSATSNGTLPKESPTKPGNANKKITNFFNK